MLFFQHMKPNLLAALAALLLIAGCASSPVGMRPYDSGETGGAGRAVAAPGSTRTDPGRAAGTTPFAPGPRDERPGLATRWGDDRDSRVESVSFRRHDSDPGGQGRVFYNNRAGLDAMWAQGYGTPARIHAAWMGEIAGIECRLRSGNGDALPAWLQAGDYFVEGRSGERYAIVLRNATAVRREVVVSVDGLDVLDGAPATTRCRGYVLDPGEEFAVEGFRKSSDRVAAFEFGSVPESYAKLRHGSTRNVGVIGIAVFVESNRDAERRRSADPFPGRWATPPSRY